MEPQQPQTSPWVVPFSIIVAGALIGGGIYMSSKAPVRSPNLQNNQKVETIPVKPLSSDDHIQGNPNAPVVIIEFSDIECPYCKLYSQTMEKIIQEYGPSGKVARVYRHFPLHQRSQKEAEATECAAKISGNEIFWKYLSEVYKRTNSNDSLDPTELPKIATSLGIDEKKFNDCLNSGETQNLVRDDYNEAKSLKIEGTPFSILIAPNGEKVTIEGAQPYEIMKSIIDTALLQESR